MPRLNLHPDRLFLAAVAIFVAAVMPAQALTGWENAEAIVTAETVNAATLNIAMRSPHPAVRKAALFRAAFFQARLEQDSVETGLIIAALADPVWSVRRMACIVVDEHPLAAARPALEILAQRDSSILVRTRAISALARLHDPRSLPIFDELIGDTHFAIRGTAAKEIPAFASKNYADRLRVLSQSDPEEYVRVRAREALAKLDTETSAPLLDVTQTAPRLLHPLALFFGVAFCFLAIAVTRAILKKRLRLALSFVILFILAPAIGFILFMRTPPRMPRTTNEVSLVADQGIEDLPIFREGAMISTIAERIARIDAPYGVVVTVDAHSRISGTGSSFSAGRGQFDAEKILTVLRETAGERNVALLTGKELYQEPFYSTFGVGAPGVSVISLMKIDPVYQGEGGGDTESMKVFYDRAVRLIVHEIGHMRGLNHCVQPRCVMRSIEEVEDFYRIDENFCADCRSRLSHSTLPGRPGDRN